MVTEAPFFSPDFNKELCNAGNPLVKIRALTLPGYSSCDKLQSFNSPNRQQDVSIIDRTFETSKVLKHINKVLLRLSDDDLQGFCLPTGTRNSACCSLSLAEIGQHLVALRTGYISRLSRPLVQKFMLHPKNVNIFNHPVDPIALDLPNYNSIVQEPMDLGTVRNRLQCGFYSSIERCFKDVRLVFENAITFNGPSHYVAMVAQELLTEFEEDVKSLEEKASKECDRKSQHKCTLCSGSLCQLCGDKCLKFETPSLFCHSTSCGQRIKKNAVYYISADGSLVWCQKCHGGLPSTLYDDVPGVKSIPKRSLLKRKFDEEIAEPWVECDKCGNWFHQVCALYSLLGNEMQPFTCPMCVLETGKKPAIVSPLNDAYMPDYPTEQGVASPSSHVEIHDAPMVRAITDQRMWKASALPRTKLSDFLEAAIRDVLVSVGHPEVIETIHIRMTSNYDNKLEIPTCVRDNFQTAENNCLNESLAFRQKCIQLFQTIDGVDVCLFCLYVQEFDASCPLPNRNSVYIAYLDSVDYMRPSSIRTAVYQEIVVGYLKWAQARGFKQCHLWSCPPQRGDNFIFWCHPSHQRTPSRDRLNSWYSSIFHRCKSLRIAKQTDKFWNAYFSAYQANRREENSCRQAAKNSFVSSGKIGSLSLKKSKVVSFSEKQQVREEDSNASPVSTTPICPPIFDGDYWMIEFSRLHHSLMQKDPLTGSSQAQSHYRWCRDTVKALYCKPMATAFRMPVDPVALNIPMYFVVIKNPMDLGTVREKLRSNKYSNILAFVMDVRLVFHNAMLFNPASHVIHEYAKLLLGEFEKNLSDYVSTWLTALIPADGNVDELLGQCKLACHISCLKPQDSSANMQQSASQSQTATDCITPSSLISPFITSRDDQDMEERPRTVRIIVDEPFSETRKRTLTRVNSEDSSYLTVDSSMSMLDCDSSVVGMDTDGCLALSKKRRGNSLDSLSTAAEMDDTMMDMLADETMSTSTTDMLGRDSLSSIRNPVFSELQEDDFCATAFNKSLEVKPFVNPLLAMRTLNSLMTDLSKSVHRMSDDLFVVRFHDLSSAADVPFVEPKPTDKPVLDNHQQKRNRGRPANGSQQSLRVEWSDTCLSHLAALQPDTSDPDPIMRSPLMDSRYTFLETCQYRHYQFDTLRRAKYSSLMILYFLHNPYDRTCRPTCKMCQGSIQHMRWHCDQCPDYDICHTCKMSAESGYDTSTVQSRSEENCGAHPHPLTPYRVSFR